jgi:carbon monoxide dehydrogenase subunit G
MTEIKSESAQINKPIKEVFEHLSVPANYEELMPSKVRSFSALDDSATLDIEGIGKVELAFTDKIEYSNLKLEPQNKVPFKFDLQWHLTEISSSLTEVKAVINAQLNFMMKMMAEGMLKDFLNVQVHKLGKKLND